MTDSMQAQQTTSYLFGGNAAYLEELYEQYLTNPQAVPAELRNYFAGLNGSSKDVSHAAVRAYFQELTQRATSSVAATPVSGDVVHERKQAKINKLTEAYRRLGHFQASLDPLGLTQARVVSELDPAHYGLTTDKEVTEVVARLKKIYCGNIAFEYQHLTDSREVEWLRSYIETKNGEYTYPDAIKHRILQRLVEAEGLEKYLGAKYVGQTRFSLEGGDSLMPMLDELVQRASSLNVLVNLLGKSPAEICQGFEGKTSHDNCSGDVKYHLGFASNIETEHGAIHLALAFNPSHLEIINPVVEGSVRARQQRRGQEGFAQVMPVLIHGDAALAGQGVIMETFALSQTQGYGTGGTLHIVINNQIGYTTNPSDARSSWYCTDVIKMIDAPIIHVNGDDPEAALFAIQLALEYRMTFRKDVMVDLVCYRRLGHNEGDEPSATQPTMYQLIKQHSTVLKLYSNQLVQAGVITQEEVDAQIKAYRDQLDVGKEIVAHTKKRDAFVINWKPYLDQDWRAAAKTTVTLAQLQTLAQEIETLPEGMTLQPQVAKMLADRRKMTVGEIAVDWGYAETMAYATLLNEGYAIRISGEDVGRGTFAHRHAMLHDYQTGKIYIPLEQVAEQPNAFAIYNSILSEEAVVGFEYGYASSSPETLVIWEAQYGDFVNGAQVIIDQFISSAEQKWGKRLCGLVMLLPHGYEGAGPEHSSARLERFLQLCAEQNMQVCVPSNAAQIFHLLRRQMVRPYRKPLIVLTPKSLLRTAKSNLKDLAEGQFQLIIPEVEDIKVEKARRVILCSGKVYYDLMEKRRANQQQDIAIIRVEQLYPFPEKELTAELQRYKKAKEIVWCQEEPKNQGAWYATQSHFALCLAKWQSLRYVGRAAAASPATGYKSMHVAQQKELVDEALK
jgi:2-oxoglutarate dehydrogenase E1 component